MDRALWMDHGGALVRPQPKKPPGLDQLQPLVGECGRVHGDLWPHGPVGVFQSIRGRRSKEPLLGPVPERAAARCQYDPPHARARVALDALEDGAVLAVDGQDPRHPPHDLRHPDLAGENRDLFRGEGQVLPRGDRGQGRLESRRADDGDEDDVGAGQGREVRDAPRAGQEAGAPREGAVLPRLRACLCVKERGVGDGEFAGDLGQLAPIGARGDADELEALPVGGDDAQRVAPDGAGRPQQDDAPAGACFWPGLGRGGHVRHRWAPYRSPRRKYPTGAARIRRSLRSKMPPIPGTPPPESFWAARRLMTDSTRSETMATAARGAARRAPRSGPMSAGRTPRPSQNTSAPTPVARSTPPAAPSQVFLGLIPGAIAWRPTARPARSAPTSQNFATATTQRHRTSRPSGAIPSPSTGVTIRTRYCRRSET